MAKHAMCSPLLLFVSICFTQIGTVVVVIVWYLDLQLPMQSMSITTNRRCGFESRSWRGVLDTTLCDQVRQ